MMKKVTLILVKMGNRCHLHMSAVLNLKPDTSVRKIFINVRNVTAALIRKSVSKGIIVKPQCFFGELKQDMQFRRYLNRGTWNVLSESVFLAMAKNRKTEAAASRFVNR